MIYLLSKFRCWCVINIDTRFDEIRQPDHLNHAVTVVCVMKKDHLPFSAYPSNLGPFPCSPTRSIGEGLRTSTDIRGGTWLSQKKMKKGINFGFKVFPVQGYLAHKKPPAPLAPMQEPRYGPTVVS